MSDYTDISNFKYVGALLLYGHNYTPNGRKFNLYHYIPIGTYIKH